MTKKIVALAGDGIGPEIMEDRFRSSGGSKLKKQVLTMRLIDDLLEVQVSMLQGIPYLMKLSRYVVKQMLFS